MGMNTQKVYPCSLPPVAENNKEPEEPPLQVGFVGVTCNVTTVGSTREVVAGVGETHSLLSNTMIE